MNIFEKIEKKLFFYKKEKLYRSPYKIEERQGKYVIIKGEKLLSFSSNDYLGLASSGRINKIVSDAFLKYGPSSSSSRLISGNYSLIVESEKKFAEYFGYEDAIFFPSGYQANIALISSLFEKDDIIVFDKHCHSSIIKGILLSGAKYFGFNHNSIDHLKKRLSKLKGSVSLITESLFSMDGDLLDKEGIKELKEKYGFLCIVDEAHSFGVLGEKGKGIARDVADVAVGTFGKAFGFFGAFLLLPKKIKEYLFNFSHPLIHSTALPHAHAEAASRILDEVERAEKQRKKLLSLASILRNRLKEEGFIAKGDAQIISLFIGDEEKSLEVSKKLLKLGIFIPPVRYPTVPLKKAILRISVTALHDEEDIGILIRALKESY